MTLILINLYHYFRLSIIIIILENRNLHTLEEDIHDWHPDLKAKLTPDDKCWKNESFTILEKCDLCSGKKLNVNQFHGIFYNLKKKVLNMKGKFREIDFNPKTMRFMFR